MDIWLSGSGNSGPSKINKAHNICVHVVPHFGGVLITMSDGRNTKSSHRELSAIKDRYLTVTKRNCPRRPRPRQATTPDGDHLAAPKQASIDGSGLCGEAVRSSTKPPCPAVPLVNGVGTGHIRALAS